ncbi:response regulator [Antarcticibacterium sp. 1MA-6-2]|uniref:response regulator n=1 Tax=Antarcticibacterium sp. 1MA-6-2 TaxID=2908210 RepID=UPI001F3674D9|nr:response regulator [Antarcticibacterium sp. 1MA-6-2]UJH91338.1 response regulator [Antarcticibacterium sp. 1MA-6-2]
MLKVLLIDDDEIVLLVQRKLLQRCNFEQEIISYRSAKSALNYLSQVSDSDDFLILLDVNMPQMNGWDFISQLSKMEVVDRTHILMVTSSIELNDKEVAENYPNVFDFIEKPFNADNCKKIRSIPALKNYF